MDNNQIVTFSEEALNKLFENTPDVTVTADSLEGARADVQTGTDTNIPTIDLDKLDEPVNQDNNGTDDPPPADDKGDKNDNQVVADTPEQKVALKNTVDFLIEKGIWKDFEGREELQELDSETYAQLAAAQDAERLNERFNELVDSTGDYGKAIIEHIKNGGDPEEIIDLFKEQRELESFDTSSEQGKLDYIYTYYSEILGMKPDKIKLFIENTILKSDNKQQALETEFAEVEDKFKQYYSQEIEKVKQAQLDVKKQNEEKQKLFVNNIKDALQKEDFLTEQEKKIIEKSITEFKHKLPNGAVVNDFYVKFAEKQKDPAEYVKLVSFILDREGYENKIAQKKDTKVTEKKWDFLKSINAKKSGSVLPNQNSDNAGKLDFSVILKNKK